MKKPIVFLFLMAGALATYAQDGDEYSVQDDPYEMRTLMGASHSTGGYGAISFQYAQIDDRDAFVFGARGGVLLGHMIAIGIGGKGFFNDGQYNSITGADVSLAGGYGGFFFEPILVPNFPVHVSFPVLFGAGGVGIMSLQNNDWEDTFNSEASDAFMVIEPGVELELNITHFFRFCIGGYYRYTSDIDVRDPDYEVSSDILRGFSGGVTFKFGRF